MTITHRAIDVNALGRLRRHLGLSDPEPPAEESNRTISSGPLTVGARARGVGRRLAAPVLKRARAELALAARHEQASLRAEVDELRGELARTRTSQAAELAALHEEMRRR